MIALILTGGTIGACITEEGTIELGESRLVEMYSHIDKETEFEIMRPIDTLSENIGLDEWSRLITALNGLDMRCYDGVIIAHGSDTLAYTSALIGMLYSHAELPICLIAADYPLEDSRSNGLDNMRAAVALIKEGIRGVWTIYADFRGQKKMSIYLASRLIEADTYNDRFSCYGSEPFGYMYMQDLKPKLNVRHAISGRLFGEKINIHELKNRVLFIRPYPALDYTSINIEGYTAIVHYSYHAGTACVKGETTGLNVFAERCRQAGIDLYFGSLKSPDQNLYASSAEILSGSITPVYNISPCALYMKALIAYNQTEHDPRMLMLENLGHEVLPARI